MFDRKRLAPVLALVLVASAVVPGAAAMTRDRTAQQSASAYAGTHVSFDTAGDAIVNYTVDGATVAESVRVQSQSKARANAGVDIGADLSAVTSFAGAALSVDTTTEMHATITAESGAKMQAHDNGHGSLVVAANGKSQVVGMNLSSAASAEAKSDQRVVVTTKSGAKTAVLVAGEGSVTVNDDGNVTAKLGSEGRLVVRSYEDGKRSESDKKQEELITSGAAAAQVYLTEKGSDVVDYGQQTSVKVRQKAEGTVKMTVERSQSQGKVVITSVSEAVVQNAENLQVKVDGEAAAKASSYSALKAAANGGDTSKYMVQQSSSAEASADVMVAVNHFSSRDVTMSSSDGSGSGSDSDGGDGSSDGESTPGSSGPGFTVVMALLAMAAIAGLAGYRSR